MTRATVPAPSIHMGPAPAQYDPQDQTEFRRQVQDSFDVIEGRARLDAAGPPKGAGFVREVPSESGNVGTLTLIPISGAEFDEVHASTQRGNATWSAWAPLTANASGDYVDTVALVEKHNSKVAYRIYVNAEIVQENVVTFDYGTVANIQNLVASYDGVGTATVTAKFDTDIRTVGTPEAEFSLDAGTSWTAFAVDPARTGTFTVAQSLTASQTALVRGYNEAGVAGDSVSIEIEKYSLPPALGSATSSTFYNSAVPQDEYTATWEQEGAVNDTDYAIEVKFYRNGTVRHSSSAVLPSAEVYTWNDTSPGVSSDLYKARVTLYKTSNNGVVRMLETFERIRTT